MDKPQVHKYLSMDQKDKIKDKKLYKNYLIKSLPFSSYSIGEENYRDVTHLETVFNLNFELRIILRKWWKCNLNFFQFGFKFIIKSVDRFLSFYHYLYNLNHGPWFKHFWPQFSTRCYFLLSALKLCPKNFFSSMKSKVVCWLSIITPPPLRLYPIISRCLKRLLGAQPPVLIWMVKFHLA